ncbi:MAG: UBA/TS-N domain protein, partial [Lachnospiraceae bacterium]|nr:UBA/TS-N domain protein [Lachnospiraceae bacterium]
MENYEKVEKLRERANVSYEEAKEALENNNWDILDAMIALEKSGKTKGTGQAGYSTQGMPKYEGVIDDEPESKHDFCDACRRFGRWCA